MSISSLKRASAAINNQYVANADAENKKRSYGDENYWTPVQDKNGVGSAVIRFLPGIPLTNQDDPNLDTPYIKSLIRNAIKESKGSDVMFEPGWVRKWQHGFQGPSGAWYIENNRNSMAGDSENIPDPVTDYNAKLWRTKDELLVDQARRQKRKLLHISNIYVVKHPGRPEDEGKVFLFGYGKKIMDKILAMIKPEDEDQDPVPVFDFWQGANFRLKIRKVSGYRNYDESTFDAPKPLLDDDDKLEQIYSQARSLLREVGKDKFKSYEELERKLNEVLDDSAPARPTASAPSRPKAQAEDKPMVDDDEPPFDVEDEKPAKTLSAKDFFKQLKPA